MKIIIVLNAKKVVSHALLMMIVDIVLKDILRKNQKPNLEVLMLNVENVVRDVKSVIMRMNVDLV